MPKHPWLNIVLLLVMQAGLPAIPAAAAGPVSPPPGAVSATAVTDGSAFTVPNDNRSPAQERAMLDQIRRNIAQLRRAGLAAPLQNAQAVTYDFPLRQAPGLAGEAGFYLSALADHDPAAGKVLDYHGGSRTYDGHRAIDIALWPFPWNKLDDGVMQVVAAAAGTIVAKADANPADHNCGKPNAGDWNYLALEHADGRMTIYGHMRYHSLTAKAIGQKVARGELLGTAGSSGNSSGPHLHFEVRAASFSAVWIDPFAGPHSQAESLWTEQSPYVDPAINLLSTHAGPPSMPDPCLPAVTRQQDSFSTPGNVYIYAYYRDFEGKLPTELSVHRPDGSLFRSWTYSEDAAFFTAAFLSWVAQLPGDAPAGTWRVAATYNGRRYETYFNVNAPPTLAVVSPNGGEQWDPLQSHPVSWRDNIGGAVNLTLLRGDIPIALIAAKIPSDGSFRWTPGPDLATGPGYGLRLSSVINPALFDDSDAPFALEAGTGVVPATATAEVPATVTTVPPATATARVQVATSTATVSATALAPVAKLLLPLLRRR